MTSDELATAIHAIEFDHVFTLHPDGSITEPSEVWAPSVFYDDENDIFIDGAGWHAITGLTGQDRYHGAVMHPSEFISSGVAEVMWERAIDAEAPITFTLVVVECWPEEDDPEPAPAGWAILYREASSMFDYGRCPVCGEPMVFDDDADVDLHSMPDGADCHAECCPICTDGVEDAH